MRYFGHEIEVIGPQGAGEPHIGIVGVRALFSFCIHGDPFRMSIISILVGGMRIGAGQHHHALFAATLDQAAKKGLVAGQPVAAVVELDIGGIEGHHASGGKAGSVGVDALEVIQPEGHIHTGRIIFGHVDLRPAHRPIEPVIVAGRGHGQALAQLAQHEDAAAVVCTNSLRVIMVLLETRQS